MTIDGMITEEDNIITLEDPEGNEASFLDIACISYNNEVYEILQPVELGDAMKEDEALLFHVIKDKDGDSLEVETDQQIIKAVFEKYEELLKKQMEK